MTRLDLYAADINNMTIQSHPEFLVNLFTRFNASKIVYCLTRNHELLYDVIPDDIDILVNKDQMPDIDQIIRSVTGDDFLLIKRVMRNYHIQYYITSSEELKLSINENRAAEIIQLDFVSDLQWKGIPYLKTKEALHYRVPHKDFYILDQSHHIAHVMYHAILDKKYIKDKYASIIQSGYEEHSAGITQCTLPLLGSNLCKKITDATRAGDMQQLLSLRRSIISRIILHPLRIAKLAAFMARKYLRILKAILMPPGILLTAVGPDGVGKTTLLERCRLALSNCYDPMIDIYMGWKEFILPSKRILLALLKLKPSRNKHKEANQDKESKRHSIEPPQPSWTHNLSVIHYFVDLWARYVVKIRPILARGGFVSCDRYFYDVLTQNVWLTNNSISRWLLIMLSPSPTLTIIFTGDAATIAARKNENTVAETEKQIQAFRILNNERSPVLVLEATNDLNQNVFKTLSKIIAIANMDKIC